MNRNKKSYRKTKKLAKKEWMLLKSTVVDAAAAIVIV